mmetsp:Transcript_22301/g.46887  ORF Transcript_22301/g.46887 Transcript_22301/m.46887 type:complete len:209 (-) Transcript_22301:617-1243(-)
MRNILYRPWRFSKGLKMTDDFSRLFEIDWIIYFTLPVSFILILLDIVAVVIPSAGLFPCTMAVIQKLRHVFSSSSTTATGNNNVFTRYDCECPQPCISMHTYCCNVRFLPPLRAPASSKSPVRPCTKRLLVQDCRIRPGHPEPCLRPFGRKARLGCNGDSAGRQSPAESPTSCRDDRTSRDRRRLCATHNFQRYCPTRDASLFSLAYS